jgi:hypothetical protein
MKTTAIMLMIALLAVAGCRTVEERAPAGDLLLSAFHIGDSPEEVSRRFQSLGWEELPITVRRYAGDSVTWTFHMNPEIRGHVHDVGWHELTFSANGRLASGRRLFKEEEQNTNNVMDSYSVKAADVLHRIGHH